MATFEVKKNGGSPLAPITLEEVRAIVARGSLAPHDLIRPTGDKSWRWAWEARGLFGSQAIRECRQPGTHCIAADGMPPIRVRHKNGQEAGPFLPKRLKLLAVDGLVGPDDLVQLDGTSDWLPAHSIEGLFAADDRLLMHLLDVDGNAEALAVLETHRPPRQIPKGLRVVMVVVLLPILIAGSVILVRSWQEARQEAMLLREVSNLKLNVQHALDDHDLFEAERSLHELQTLLIRNRPRNLAGLQEADIWADHAREALTTKGVEKLLTALEKEAAKNPIDIGDAERTVSADSEREDRSDKEEAERFLATAEGRRLAEQAYKDSLWTKSQAAGLATLSARATGTIPTHGDWLSTETRVDIHLVVAYESWDRRTSEGVSVLADRIALLTGANQRSLERRLVAARARTELTRREALANERFKKALERQRSR